MDDDLSERLWSVIETYVMRGTTVQDFLQTCGEHWDEIMRQQADSARKEWADRLKPR